jgi:hypothetical protein
MFSLEKFYNIISLNLLAPIKLGFLCFEKFGSTDIADLVFYYSKDSKDFVPNGQQMFANPHHRVLYYDQEPIYLKEAHKIWGWDVNNITLSQVNHGERTGRLEYFILPATIIANSEISDEKDMLIKYDPQHRDWYYFFHGFAALDWFGDIKYYPPVRNYSRVFICFNNLYLKNRSYRLNLIARLIQKNIDTQGYISLPNQNLKENIKDELFSKESRLSTKSKKIIYDTIYTNPPSLSIDTDTVTGELSANMDLNIMSKGLFHIVTETIFYDQKLHLTEKIFKPIVARRPFFLVGAPGNLAYLKSYGFKTFDRWIDESYDLEKDPDLRISLIVQELERLCQLPPNELDELYKEMWEVLDYNFEWFYDGFKKHIVNELVDNFRDCLISQNAGLGRNSAYVIDYSSINFETVKRRLAQ